MKTEDFDEVIREKLENLTPTYTESDIEVVYRNMVRKRRFQIKGGSGSWILYSLLAAAFIAVTFLAVSHFRNTSEVVLVNDEPSINLNLTVLDSVYKPFTNSDTAQFIKSDSTIKAVQKVRTPVFESPISISGIKNPENTNPNSLIVPEKQINSSNETVNSIEKSVFQTINNISKLSDALPETVASTTNIKKTEDLHEQFVAEKSQQQNVIPADSMQLALKQQNTSIITLQSDNSVLANNPDSVASAKKQNYKFNPGAVFNGTKFSVGPGFQFSNQAVGTAISVKLLLKNRFGIETGLNYSVLKTEHFVDTADMFKHKRTDFHHDINGHFNDKGHITEISITNRLLHVPIEISYTIPLKRNYGLSFSAGTNLDIYLNQKLSFNHNTDSGRADIHKFEDKGKATVFNNLILSAGIEKRWKSIAFQVQPIISLKTKDVFYKPKEMEIGVDFSVKYCFGR